MYWLIYGAKGWIGQQFIKNLNEINYNKNTIKSNHNENKNKSNDIIVIGKARLENYSQLLKEVLQYPAKETCILSFTGRTHGPGFTTIDYLEQKGKLAINIRDNLYGPLNLAIIAQKYNYHYTYLGTGCIYKYDNPEDTIHRVSQPPAQQFLETDVPNFVGSGYSIVKGFTDQLLDRYSENVLNVRIRMPITSQDGPRNFITKIVNYEKVVNIPNSMTVLTDMYPIIIDMCQRRQTGKYNLTNPGVISHNEILDMYQLYVDETFEYQNFTEEEQNQILLAERSNNYLNTDKLEKYCQQYNLNLPNIHQSVKNTLQNWESTTN